MAFFLSVLLLYFPGWTVVNRVPELLSAQVYSSSPAGEFENQRLQMVQQLRERGIQDRAVLKAMSEVPRHRFVATSQAPLAYGDFPLPIGQGQTISQPYIVAYMTEAAQVSSQEKVLEVGTGSGYQAAVLGELAKEVYTIEIIPQLGESAGKILAQLGYQNVYGRIGNGYQGWAEHAPYDAIVVTAAPGSVPEALLDQLALNGKLVIPVGTANQELLVITKTQDGLIKQRTIPVRFVPLTGSQQQGQ